MDNVRFHIGEVITKPANMTPTYLYDVENNYEIFVRTKSADSSTNIQAIPFNTCTQIPLVGEHVLLVEGISAEDNNNTIYNRWYYISSFSLNSNVNANMLPGISDTPNVTTVVTSFVEQPVSSLQYYEGDYLIEGRYSNSIRFSSTINGGRYSVPPTWRGPTSDPIIILSNGRKYKKDSYTVENIETDASSIYLTSTQKLPLLLLGDKNNRNPLKKYISESQYDKSQVINIAERVIIKAKSDIVVIDSPKAIILNTSGEISLGSDTASEPMVHGHVLFNMLQKILDHLSGPILCGGLAGQFIDISRIPLARKDLQQLRSSTFYMDKNIYKP